MSKRADSEFSVELGSGDKESRPMSWPGSVAYCFSWLCFTAILISFFYFGGCKLLQH